MKEHGDKIIGMLEALKASLAAGKAPKRKAAKRVTRKKSHPKKARQRPSESIQATDMPGARKTATSALSALIAATSSAKLSGTGTGAWLGYLGGLMAARRRSTGPY